MKIADTQGVSQCGYNIICLEFSKTISKVIFVKLFREILHTPLHYH